MVSKLAKYSKKVAELATLAAGPEFLRAEQPP